MTVYAEPVSLESDNAVIYEQANEESSAVGNLVRGSNFELLESVTLEDGSTWYHVSALGIQGYMKGDVSIGAGTAVTEPEEVVPEESASAEPENAAGGAETENTVETQTAEEAETEIAGETEEEMTEEQPAAYQGSNMREKTYSVGSSALRVQDGESQTAEPGSISQEKSTEKSGRRLSTTAFFFWAVLIGSGLTAWVSYKKCREEAGKSRRPEKKQTEGIKPARNKKSLYKKRKHKKKKGKAKKNGNTKK